jgi:hypothetical protein
MEREDAGAEIVSKSQSAEADVLANFDCHRPFSSLGLPVSPFF